MFKNLNIWIEKLRVLPEKDKKVVLWTIVAVLGASMGLFWIKVSMDRFSEMGNKLGQLNLPQIEFSETQNLETQTENWKTYISQEYGFEIKYPDEWHSKEIEKGIVGGGIYFSFEAPDESEAGGMAFINEALSVNVEKSQDSLLQFAENYLNLSVAEKAEIENIKIGGENSLKVIVGCDGVGCGGPSWFVKKNDDIYIFDSGLSSKIGVFEQMLSTFKFIEK